MKTALYSLALYTLAVIALPFVLALQIWIDWPNRNEPEDIS